MTREDVISELGDLLCDKHIDTSYDLLKILSDDILKQLYIFFELEF